MLAAMSAVTFAQQETISFEASEGYQLGTIHNQNGWTVTQGSGGFIQNQVISAEKSKTGSYSFKNAHEPTFPDQWFPIFGAVREFAEPASYNGFTISYDVLATGQMGADFEFVLYSVDENEEFVPVAGVGIENRGFIYLIDDVNYGFEYAVQEWTPNTWVNIRIEVTAASIKYYVNNTLELDIANYTQLDILGFNMLHNNYGNDAYYDNIVVTRGTMSSDSFSKSAITTYPNPAKDILNIQAPDGTTVSNVEIYTINGQKLMESTTLNVNVSSLANGMYIAKIYSEDGASQTKKFLKK